MQQLQAGYFSEAVLNELKNDILKTYIEGLFYNLSFFDIQSNVDLKINKDADPIALIINNLVSRGLPTIPSCFIEDILSTTFLKTKKKNYGDHFTYEFINDELKELIVRSLFIIDPRLEAKKLKKQIKFTDTEKELKEKFLFEIIPIEIGEYFIQLITPNRSLKSVFENTPVASRMNVEVFDENIDFAIENPFVENEQKGILIDLKKYNPVENIDYLEEEKKKNLLRQIYWNGILRIEDLNNNSEQFQEVINFTFSKYFDILRKNFTSPLYNSEAGLDALQLALTPIEIARIEKIILLLILSNYLNIEADKWKIAIIERDIPGAFLAIEDLKQQFKNLFKLEGHNRKLPEIELTIYYENEFENAELNILYQGNILSVSDFDHQEHYDVIIDSSILRRSNYDISETPQNADFVIKSRSSQYVHSVRKFATADNVNYNFSITKDRKQGDKIKAALNYFLKNIFRKNSFSYQQFLFLEKSLQAESLLANFPFIYSKTLLYQFSVLLQPGISIVITPIDALMKDQIDALKQNYIDAVSYYSPATTDVYERDAALSKFKYSRSIFNFIDADRFHLLEVRQIFTYLQNNDVNISYFIVDEAHSVSEFSHDFRTIYGTLPNNIKKLYKKQVPIICLTNTASYDVMTDIALAFNIEKQNILFIENDFSRFNFKFIKVGINTQQQTDKHIVLEARTHKQDLLIKYVKGQKKTLIYHYAPLALKNAIKNLDSKEKIEAFVGSFFEKGIIISALTAKKSFNSYLKFKNNNVNILVARSSFGIGLNKADIRKIYFLDVPLSMDHFIQQINRGGRDRQKTDVFIFYSPSEIETTIGKYEVDISKIQYIEQKIKLPVEHLIYYREIARIYLNPQKEFNILNELLQNITYPTEQIQDILIRRIKYQFDLWITLQPQPVVNPNMLYLYDESKQSLGYIDFLNNKIFIEAPSPHKELAEKVIWFLKYDIEKIVANGIEIFELLNEQIVNAPIQGIAKQLATMKIGEQKSITIEFYNNVPYKLQNILLKEFDKTLSFNQIIDAYENSIDLQDFIQKIEWKINIRLDRYFSIIQSIKDVFCNFRNFHETLFALYRLMSLGIVQDFIIDYHNQQFTVIFEKKSDTQIITNLHDKIKPFFTRSKIFEVYEKIPKTTGSTIVQKAANYYVSFVHNVIYSKLKKSYLKLWNITNTHYIDDQKELKGLLNNYFSAKYISELRNNSQYDFIYIKKILEEAQFYIDEFMHLNKSAYLLLNTNPNNINYLYIKGLTDLILNEDKDDKLVEGTQILAQAINTIRFKYPSQDIQEIIDWTMDFISKHNQELHNKIETLLTIKIHTEWLSEFNSMVKKYIKF